MGEADRVHALMLDIARHAEDALVRLSLELPPGTDVRTRVHLRDVVRGGVPVVRELWMDGRCRWRARLRIGDLSIAVTYEDDPPPRRFSSHEC